MKFNLNQNVVFLHEEGGGIIESFDEGVYGVRDEHGFIRGYKENELATVHSTEHSTDGVEAHIEEDTIRESGGKKKNSIHAIDLHIEELVEDQSGMSNYDIVQKQMRELRRFVQDAQDKKIRKIVVIHGVGEGVLKREVVSFFRGINGCEIYDGNYWEYGQGATVVELRYKY